MNKVLSIGFMAVMVSLAGAQVASAAYGYGGSSGSYMRAVAPVVAPIVTPAVGQVLGAESYTFTKRLANKSQGEEVNQLQTVLNTKGFGILVVDGKFGPLTKASLIKFQVANGLVGDGIVGPLTREALNK
jgi:murein L,D-transpeptidase YcbB/YkuD